MYFAWLLICLFVTNKRQNGKIYFLGPHMTQRRCIWMVRFFLNAADRATKFKLKMGAKYPETCFINLQNIVCNDFLDVLSFVVKPVFKFKTSSHLINYQQMAVNIAKETIFQNLIILVLRYDTIEKCSPKLTF